MDISFHYFAIKSIARAAGYDEAKAQRIATFSQFIDDYNWYSYFLAGNIPNYIKQDKYDIVVNNTLGLINPVTTGFYDNIDILTLLLPRPQKFTVSAFHFIPSDEQSLATNNRRTAPSTLNDNSYISNELNELKEGILNNTVSESDSILRMGMLLHTFADTYAHQLFTGYNEDLNDMELIKVYDNIQEGKDVTDYYKMKIIEYLKAIEKMIGKKVVEIGHIKVGHVPDYTHISFDMKYTSDGSVKTHSRSNTSEFINASKEIYTFMRECLTEKIPCNLTWEQLSEKLANAFLINASKELDNGEKTAVDLLKPHWNKQFPNYQYNYSNEAVKQGFILKASNEAIPVSVEGQNLTLFKNDYSDDFYKFNMYADEHLIRLYGVHPR
ncbi:MAG: hypothetical protein RSE93_06090 [Oscillospiraceae bacterium]